MDPLENSNWTGRARKPRRELPGFENYRAVPLKPTSIDNVPYSVGVHRLRGKWLLRVGVSQERSRRSRYARFLGDMISDHYMTLGGHAASSTLDAWTALTYLACRTQSFH